MKRRTDNEEKGFNFLVCVDGSVKSFKALNHALNLAKNPKDEVIVCFAPTPDTLLFAKTVETKLEEFFENAVDVINHPID